MVGEGLPDHPADDRVVVHLLEGYVEAGREGKRAKQHGGCNSHEGGWMNEWMDGWMDGKFCSQSLIINAMNGVT